MQALIIYKLAFNQSYYMFISRLLIKIVLYSQFPGAKLINYKCFEIKFGPPPRASCRVAQARHAWGVLPLPRYLGLPRGTQQFYLKIPNFRITPNVAGTGTHAWRGGVSLCLARVDGLSSIRVWSICVVMFVTQKQYIHTFMDTSQG